MHDFYPTENKILKNQDFDWCSISGELAPEEPTQSFQHPKRSQVGILNFELRPFGSIFLWWPEFKDYLIDQNFKFRTTFTS